MTEKEGMSFMDTVAIRQYRPGDEREINALFNEVFGERRALEEWYWKFKDDPCRSMRMVTVAEANGKIVGQYASLVSLYKYHDKTLEFAQPVDNLVHADYRGGVSGLQKQMFDAQPGAMKAIGSSFGLGFPNRGAYIIGKRILKYKDLGQIPVLFKRLNLRLSVKKRMQWLPALLLNGAGSLSGFGTRASVLFQNKRMPGVRVRTVDEFDERVNALWEKVGSRHAIIACRDHRYLRWRYKKPGKKYQIITAERGKELAGYIVTDIKRTDESCEGHIIDLLTDGSTSMEEMLIAKALGELIKQNADYVITWMLPHNKTFDALTRFGFAQREAFPPINIVYTMFDHQAIDEAIMKNTDNWYLTMADSDTF